MAEKLLDSSMDTMSEGTAAAEKAGAGGGAGGGRSAGAVPEDGARVLGGYFAIVVGFMLLAATFPGVYEVQFCGDGNPAACYFHLGVSASKKDDPGGQLLAVYVFYSGLFLAGVWGAALRLSPAFRSWAWRARPNLPGGAGVGNAGQATLVTALTLLHVFWAAWWWQHLGGCVDSQCAFWTKVAKTIGHLNDLEMSLLLLLASRANVWEGVLGLGFDAGMAWHRALGTLMVVCTALHLLIWHIQWAAEGVWLEHAILYSHDPNVMLTNNSLTCTLGQTLSATCGNGHFWAIPSMELFTLTLWAPAMYLALSSTSRRKTYEKFYKWHHVFLILIPLSYFHSWHVWQYSYIGVALWAYNKYLSYSQSKLVVQVQKAAALPGGVSHLTLSTSSSSSIRRHRAGQFMYINAPEIDPWQWHPFTVSSAESGSQGDDTVCWQHHIKNMNTATDESTWTGQLYNRLTANQELTVRCHGPYGAPAFALPTDEECVVFYVGGIGCTPALSILATWAAAAASGARVPHATLVWAVRDLDLLLSFSSVLDGIAHDPEHFTLKLYCTQKGVEFNGLPEAASVGADCCFAGRPDPKAVLDDAGRKGGQSMATMGVFACGPAPMVDGVRAAAAQRARSGAHTRFHAETFEF